MSAAVAALPAGARVAVWPGATVAVALAALLVPLAVAPVPPLWDYPNHLARYYLLAAGVDRAPVSNWYALPWDGWTNMAVDWLAARATGVVGWMEAGRAVVALATLLPPVAGVLLWWSVHRRPGAWPLAFAALAWGTSLIAGFLNFQIGLGLALAAAAADACLARRPAAPLFPLRAACAALLIAIHPFGFVFYAALLAGLALGPSVAGLKARAGHLPGLAAALLLPALAFVAFAPHLPGDQVGAGPASLWRDLVAGWCDTARAPGDKLLRAGMDLWSYRLPLDLLTAGGLLLPLGLAGARLRLHAGLALAGAALFVAFALAPDRLGGTAWIDTRFAAMAPFALAAAADPALPPAAERACATLLLALCLARTAVVAEVWHARQADVAAVARALAAVEPGALVLPLRAGGAVADAAPGRRVALGGDSVRHLGTLALPLRDAFTPMLFAARGKQPVEVQPAMRALADPEGGDLADAAGLHDPRILARDLPAAPYLAEWRRFDYVLLLGADAGPAPTPASDPDLRLLADEGFARLYRIERGGDRR